MIESGDRKNPPFTEKGDLESLEFELAVLEKIISDNPAPFEALKAFIQASEDTQLVFGEGNHCRPIFHPSASLLRAKLAERIMPDISIEEREKRILFCKVMFSKELDLYSEHFHRIDPFNFSKKGTNTSGDWVVVNSNAVVKNMIEALKQNITDPTILRKLISKVERMLRIRPSIAFPLYLEYEARNLDSRNDITDIGVIKKAQEILRSYNHMIKEQFSRTPLFQTLQHRLPFPNLLSSFFSSKRVQNLGARLISFFESWFSDNNKTQAKEAKRIFRENGISNTIGAHTHNADHVEFSVGDTNCHYINPGAWPAFKLMIDGKPLGSTHPSGFFTGTVNLKARKRKGNYTLQTAETWSKRV